MPTANYKNGTFLILIVFLSAVFGLIPPPAAQQSPHGKIGFSCFACHDRDDISKLDKYPSFDHGDVGFPLTGSHKGISCVECHGDLVFSDAEGKCYTCHDDVHNNAFGFECERCHRPTSFALVEDFSGFHETTRFPLRGTHRTLACVECHTTDDPADWQMLNSDCVSCHYDDYLESKSIDHIEAGFGTDCVRCHVETTGFAVLFDHNQTGTELTGAHVFLKCVECHSGDFFRSLPTTCVTCHRDDYEAVTSPDHVDAGFSVSCEECHNTTAWIPADFDSKHSFFPLTGSHSNLSCVECHINEGYKGLSSDCVACHQGDLSESTDPDHDFFGFSRVCSDCHTTLTWIPSTYSHDVTGYPLEGTHVSVNCSACHTAAYGKKPPSDCYGCHRQDYENAFGHTTNSYPLNCLECHLQTSWEQVTFTHDAFPIYSGAHRNVWISCAECHPTSGNYSDFTCLVCHGRSKTGREHDDVGGYEYSSPSCYSCHPDGDE